jgi:hypothetical protein
VYIKFCEGQEVTIIKIEKKSIENDFLLGFFITNNVPARARGNQEKLAVMVSQDAS